MGHHLHIFGMWSSTGFGGHGGRITHQRLTSWSDGYFLEDSNLGGGYNTTLPLLTKLSLCDSVLWREWRETLEEVTLTTSFSNTLFGAYTFVT